MTHCRLGTTLSLPIGEIIPEAALSNEIAKAALPQLEKDRAEIEKEIGEPLIWNPYPNKRDKIIGLFRQVDLSDREAWPEYCDWLLQTVVKLRMAFMSRVKALDLSQPDATTE